MPPRVERGTIIFREWASDKGLNESEGTFHSVDELFAACLEVGDPKLVDRIVLTGQDGEGRLRTVTFTFQSVMQ